MDSVALVDVDVDVDVVVSVVGIVLCFIVLLCIVYCVEKQDCCCCLLRSKGQSLHSLLLTQFVWRATKSNVKFKMHW